MAQMGRPQIPIDQNDFRKLCQIQCTLVEIADFFECSEDTIELWCKRTYGGKTFTEVFKRESSGGRRSVRRKLFEMAQSGHFGAIVWFTKNYCGMTDRLDLKAVPPDTSDTEMKERIIREVQDILDTIEECKNTSYLQPSPLRLPS